MTSQNQRYFAPAKNILLTGAGFTRPLGGYLAREMWAAILNQPEIRENEKLRCRMLVELNYETLYDEVSASDVYTDFEKRAFKKAVRRAYEQMDDCIFQRGDPKKRDRASRMFQSFFSRFDGQKDRTRSFFFTLNQDLLVERFIPLQTLSSKYLVFTIQSGLTGSWVPNLRKETECCSPTRIPLRM